MEDPDPISLPGLITFLKAHDYPLVHGMGCDEATKVFHKSNRCFVVCWALNLLNKEYSCILKGRERDETFLADILCCQGFCTETEKAGFMDGSLDIHKQLQIFYVMFNFIDEVKKSEALTEEVKPITLEDLNILENRDLNLFPNFAIKPLSNEEYQCISDQESILEELYKLHLKSDNLHLEIDNNKKNLETALKFTKTVNGEINENFSKFEKEVNSVQLLEQKKKIMSSNKKPKYEIDPTSGNLFAECNENLRIINQYIDNLKTLQEFKVEVKEQPDYSVFKLLPLLANQLKQ
ncbi:unnamed protein product [Ceutorhynchus assimilis]|uniref:Uncharacterized protein n=1 Tax=Ceutorhynchus assimilis TaxID=467358 RepID=A0A9N9MUL2_9CUCU|nr:unnamed protein product [Ceutorhynchus assimilis]